MPKNIRLYIEEDTADWVVRRHQKRDDHVSKMENVRLAKIEWPLCKRDTGRPEGKEESFERTVFEPGAE